MYAYKSIFTVNKYKKSPTKFFTLSENMNSIIFTHLSIFFFVFFFSPNSDKCSCRFMIFCLFLISLNKTFILVSFYSVLWCFYVFFKDNRYFFTHRLFPFLKGIFSKLCHIPLHIYKAERGTVAVWYIS